MRAQKVSLTPGIVIAVALVFLGAGCGRSVGIVSNEPIERAPFVTNLQDAEDLQTNPNNNQSTLGLYYNSSTGEWHTEGVELADASCVWTFERDHGLSKQITTKGGFVTISQLWARADGSEIDAKVTCIDQTGTAYSANLLNYSKYISTPKNESLLRDREKCNKEFKEKADAVDRLVQSVPNITKEQAQNIGRNAGIVDERGYVIDSDIWVKKCMEKKAEVFN